MSAARVHQLVETGRALVRLERAPPSPRPGEVVVEVAGCGVCHTDLGFWLGHVVPRAGLPLVLGHEIAGTVSAAGAGASEWVGREVIVPAVIPCGDCAPCARGRGNACSRQFMPGNDGDGGFATHVAVPARGLCPVVRLPEGHVLADLAVIADAVSTPWQALKRARVGAGDFVVVVGVGGVGTYAVQLAGALGATVVALDIDEARLAAVEGRGVTQGLCSRGLSAKEVRETVQGAARSLGAPREAWKVLECSGTTGGQETAFGLVGPLSTLALIGYTRESVSVRLSNLMAFDADAFGSWGCPPELYPEVLGLVQEGRITLAPFVRKVPLDGVNDLLRGDLETRDFRRPVLIP